MKRWLFMTLVLVLVALLAAVPAIGEGSPAVEWTVENATEAFASEVILPENAAQYKKVLTAPLTEEQSANFQEGIVVIYVPNVITGDEKAIQGICYLPVELTDDNQLKADFSGLYVSVDEEMSENLRAQLVTTRPILMSRQESLNDASASLSMKGVFYGELEVMYNPFTIRIDYTENTAKIESIVLEEAERKPLNGYYSAFRYTYVVNEDGELPHFLDMQSTAMTVWYEKKITEPRTIRLRPVKGAGCKVLFSITNKDGTKYSLAPVNYN